ncbi:homocysteine S-methyltransferase family protein [Chloroflexi bacterium TSY]|nr:homocysteine S-methyltransferase family protein [Chloroflexi bacterium TSY]
MTNRYEQLAKRMQNGEQVLIDGATGTEVERRGVPQLEHAWNGGGAKTHPDVLKAIHCDYIKAGAQIIISNTFATGRHNLEDAGCSEDFDYLNRRGVELAIQAREESGQDEVLVAAGISHWDFNDNPPTFEQLRINVEDQAAIMVEAGAELIMLEMMAHIDKMNICIDAAQKTGLPVWVGMSCDLAADGAPKLLHQGTLSEAISALQGRGIPLVSIMHTQVDYVDASLDVLQDEWDGLVGVYAHSGIYRDGKLIFDSVISPEDYAVAVSGWLRRGVNLVGGCCGVGVEHMLHLQRMMS